MANLYKKTYPVPMPDGAEVIQRRGKTVVRWTDKRGNTKTAPLADDGKRMMYVSDVWYARYKDINGRERRVSTGCRDEQVAAKKLADITAEQEKLRIGFITPQELDTAEHGKRPIAEHIDEYIEHLKSKRVRGRKVSAHYQRNVRGRLLRIVRDRSFTRLSDITSETINRWMDDAEDADMAAATRNEYLTSMIAFCNWLVREGRLIANPLAQMQKADRSADRRHLRRALTVEDVSRLLEAAARRPIAELGRRPVPLKETEKKGRKSWTYEPLTDANLDACHARGMEKLVDQPERRGDLERLGRERSLFYLIAVSTGLRRKELASLTIGQIHLDAVPVPHLQLHAHQTKSGSEANLPLRPEATEQLRDHLGDRAADASLDSPLFDNPPTIRVFDADCRAAGIPKTDHRGRVVDIHALRTTFGTHLAVAGVHPRVAQQAMRHSRLELTTQFYTDPVLLDVAGAVNALPDFSGGKPEPARQRFAPVGA